MAKDVTALDLALARRPQGTTLGVWLYDELRAAILSGRLKRGTRLPATRDLARQYSVARGTVVATFEQLQAEGYVKSKIGAGTFVTELLPEDLLESGPSARAPDRAQQARVAEDKSRRVRAFRLNEPALDAFPVAVWTRVASRCLRLASRALLAYGDARGYGPLRDAVAGYLGASRGVKCMPGQVVIVSGVQQALDLTARLICRPGDGVWLEDPGYPPAAAAFRAAGARIVAVPVDERGLDVAQGKRRANRAKGVYVTPAHQCPLGAAMPIERRLALLEWARGCGAFVIEDDYDSEYRYSGRPIPALQGLDQNNSVIFMGSFNKVMFPALRLGYLVLPPALVDPFAKLRFNIDRFSPTLDQAILCDFINEGHFARHIRRMREIYHRRLDTLFEAAKRYLSGVIEIPRIEAGLQTAAWLRNGMTSAQAVAAAKARKIETAALDRFALQRRDIRGLVLGFAAIDEREIRRGVIELARACDAPASG